MPSRRGGKKLSFCRWHERQLYSGFGWLTLCILSGIAFATVLERFGLDSPGIWPYVTLLVLYGVGLVAITAWRRFWAMLSFAQRTANRAVCSACGAYGLFEVRIDGQRIPATCRRCGYRWTIE